MGKNPLEYDHSYARPLWRRRLVWFVTGVICLLIMGEVYSLELRYNFRSDLQGDRWIAIKEHGVEFGFMHDEKLVDHKIRKKSMLGIFVISEPGLVWIRIPLLYCLILPALVIVMRMCYKKLIH
jgi:hypothetical protein